MGSDDQLESMRCPNCGTLNPGDARECIYCGDRLAADLGEASCARWEGVRGSLRLARALGIGGAAFVAFGLASPYVLPRPNLAIPLVGLGMAGIAVVLDLGLSVREQLLGARRAGDLPVVVGRLILLLVLGALALGALAFVGFGFWLTRADGLLPFLFLHLPKHGPG